MHEENLLDVTIPEKFKDPQSGAVNVAAMAKSYCELEKRLSSYPTPPKTPDEYSITCKHGVLAADACVNSRLHEKGLSQEQAQEVYDIAEEHLIPLIKQIAADYQADREIERLVEHFGGPQKWEAIARQLYAFGSKHLPEHVLDNMASSYDGVIALYEMMKAKEPPLSSSQGNADGGENAQNTLSSMMRDPRYWRDKDPAFVAQVTKGFQNLYGE